MVKEVGMELANILLEEPKGGVGMNQLIKEIETLFPSEISETNLVSVLNRFSTLVRESGSEDERAAFDFLKQLLDQNEIPYKLYHPELYLSIPKIAELKVTSPVNRKVTAKTPSFSISTGDKWKSGEVIYVPTNQAKTMNDIFGVVQNEKVDVDLQGKIVLTEGFPMPGKLPYLTEKGVLGVIFISPGHNIHDGICTSIWGAPDLDNFSDQPQIPVLAINQQDGIAIKEMIEAGEVKVEFRTELDTGWMTCPLLDIFIEGTEEPEKYVLLHGHVDSWDVGIGDNATGDAALIEMARVLHKHKHLLKRSIRIALWPGHSTGRYAGSTWFADQFGISLERNCLAQVNCDSPGCRWATSYQYMEWMTETNDFCLKAIKESIREEAKGVRPLRSGDYSFDNIGISSFFMLSSSMPEELATEKGYYPVGGCGGNIAWHTHDDVMEIADLEILKKDILMYLTAVTRVANAPILPFNFVATANEFIETINNYQEQAGTHFDFSPILKEAVNLKEDLENFYKGIAALQTDTAPEKRTLVNEKILKLARVLVPINYSRKGKFRHDPARAVPPLPDIAAAGELSEAPVGSHYYHVLKTHLQRGSNRIIWALLQARELING
jgi:N-acetylated-alpha-linked acidic dipeptidase